MLSVLFNNIGLINDRCTLHSMNVCWTAKHWLVVFYHHHHRHYCAILCIRGTSHGPVSVCLSVPACVCVTSRCSTKTATSKITQTTPRDKPGTLVFWRQTPPRNSTGVNPCGGTKCRSMSSLFMLRSRRWRFCFCRSRSFCIDHHGDHRSERLTVVDACYYWIGWQFLRISGIKNIRAIFVFVDLALQSIAS